MPAYADAAVLGTPEFKILKHVPLGTRMPIIVAAILVGMLCQVFVAWWLGLPFVLFGVLMSLCAGVTNEPARRGRPRWENVTVAELTKADNLCRRIAKWTRDPFAFSSNLGLGAALFLLLGAVVGAVGFWFHARGDMNVRNAVWADGGIMLVLLFATGRRSGWRPKDIQLKIAPMLNVCKHLERFPDPGIEIRPMLEVRGKTEKSVPYDCRMMLKFKHAPEDFYGIQVQTSLNRVQGTPHPYMYCVLIAKRGAGLVAAVKPLLTKGKEKMGFFSNANDKKNPDLRKRRYGSEVAEPSTQEDVELVVIRQLTLGKGYHTDASDQVRVLMTAIHLAKTVWGV